MPEGPLGAPRPLAADRYGINIIINTSDGDTEKIAKGIHTQLKRVLIPEGEVVTGYDIDVVQSAGYTTNPAADISSLMTILYQRQKIRRERFHVNIVEMISTDVPQEIEKDYDNTISISG